MNAETESCIKTIGTLARAIEELSDGDFLLTMLDASYEAKVHRIFLMPENRGAFLPAVLNLNQPKHRQIAITWYSAHLQTILDATDICNDASSLRKSLSPSERVGFERVIAHSQEKIEGMAKILGFDTSWPGSHPSFNRTISPHFEFHSFESIINEIATN